MEACAKKCLKIKKNQEKNAREQKIRYGRDLMVRASI